MKAAPLSSIEGALVSALVSALVKEIGTALENGGARVATRGLQGERDGDGNYDEDTTAHSDAIRARRPRRTQGHAARARRTPAPV